MDFRIGGWLIGGRPKCLLIWGGHLFLNYIFFWGQLLLINRGVITNPHLALSPNSSWSLSLLHISLNCDDIANGLHNSFWMTNSSALLSWVCDVSRHVNRRNQRSHCRRRSLSGTSSCHRSEWEGENAEWDGMEQSGFVSCQVVPQNRGTPLRTLVPVEHRPGFNCWKARVCSEVEQRWWVVPCHVPTLLSQKLLTPINTHQYHLISIMYVYIYIYIT